MTIRPNPRYTGAMDPLAPLITALHSEGRLRVWSMIITVFGDLVQHRGGEISTARLGRLLGRVGVEQGAVRTALSRLGRDGWVHSERSGRTSLYRLSAQGLNQFAPATTRIYAPPRPPVPVDRWAIALRLDSSGRLDATLSPADEVASGAECVVTGALEQVTDAYRAALLSPAHRAALQALAVDVQALAVPMPTPLDAAAARMLLIHRWRRLVLRFPDIPADLMPDDTPLRDPRRAVAGIYARLVPETEAWLEGDSAGLPPMPPAIRSAAQRFALPHSGVQQA